MLVFFIYFFVCASLNPLQAPSRDDHPRQVLHVREDRGQQVGGLPGAAAGRVHRRVRGGAGGTQGCWGGTRVLAAHPSAAPRHRETAVKQQKLQPQAEPNR